MDELDWLARRFEEQRPRLRAVAYRMLGSVGEAEDAVQEAWLRLSGASHGEIEDLGAWLTTVVARISLNMLRSRKTRNEAYVPEPILDRADGMTPEHGALVANTVGLALLVVLETLTPAERVAFVLHDVFGMSFEEIAPIVERTPEAARQLASRARRRIQERRASPDVDVAAQRSVIEAYGAAVRDGDLQKLVAVLHPDIVLRGHAGPRGKSETFHGAEQVARRAQAFSRLGLEGIHVLVNGAAGVVCLLGGRVFSVVAFVVQGGKITEIDVVSDPDRLSRVDPAVLGGERAGVLPRSPDSIQ